MIQACVEQNVPRLVYTSSVDVVVGFDDVNNGDESLPVPKKFLFPGYPESKYRAECLVAEADGRALASGEFIGSVSINRYCNIKNSDRIPNFSSVYSFDHSR